MPNCDEGGDYTDCVVVLALLTTVGCIAFPYAAIGAVDYDFYSLTGRGCCY